MSIGSLCTVVNSLIVSARDKGTRSPIELFWTAKNKSEMNCNKSQISVAPVISDEDWKKVWSRVDHHPKLLNQCLSIEEVVGCHKEVPGAIPQ